MPSFEKLALVMVLTGVLVGSIFAFIMPMNGVSGYHHDSSLSDSQFSSIVDTSNSATSQLNQTVSSLNNMATPDVQSITFSLLSLLANALFGTLKLALALPVFLVTMFFGILTPINAFVNISPLINVLGVIISLGAVMIILRLFGIVGK
jgi:hypothetical protein